LREAFNAERASLDHHSVMETLGHANITMTLGTYSHVLPALERDAADRMDAVLAIP